MPELVVLVDDNNNPIGTADKETIHSFNTPLHRGFSLFLFNSKGELLITKRAASKKTFPGVWTNTVCGHPGPGESNTDAAKRRLKDELGIKGSDLKAFQGLTPIREVSPYRYRFADINGIVENEICPILVGLSDTNPQPNPQEIGEWKWIKWEEFLNEVKNNPQVYSPWCIEEAQVIAQTHPLQTQAAA